MELFRPGGLRLTEKTAVIIGLAPGDRVLDIGCGFGTSLCFLRDKFNIDAFGLDKHPCAVKKAAACLGEDRVICGDACRLPYADSSFDAVFMECVLTLTDSPENALAEIRRVLKPGGCLALSSLDGADALLDKGRIGREALLKELEQLGFETLVLSDETAELRRFVCEIIFQYDSIEAYIETANREVGGSVLSCEVPIKGTGYLLLVARKKLEDI